MNSREVSKTVSNSQATLEGDESGVLQTLLNFDFTKLIKGDMKTKKRSLLDLFTLLNADVFSAPASGTNSPRMQLEMDAPLIIKDDIIYLAINSGENSIFKLHLLVSKKFKTKSSLLDSLLMTFVPLDYKEDHTFLTIKKESYAREKDIERRVYELPDPEKSIVFCSWGSAASNLIKFRFCVIGDREEDLPSCSSSDNDEDLSIASISSRNHRKLQLIKEGKARPSLNLFQKTVKKNVSLLPTKKWESTKQMEPMKQIQLETNTPTSSVRSKFMNKPMKEEQTPKLFKHKTNSVERNTTTVIKKTSAFTINRRSASISKPSKELSAPKKIVIGRKKEPIQSK